MQQRTEFEIPGLREERQAIDLGNSLMAVTGVSNVDFDEANHKVGVDYDSAYATIVMLEKAIEGSGYPLSKSDGHR
ncbi:MAG TPA: heavy-metal-associated domain-containing protein [Chloroflexota bacterium]